MDTVLFITDLHVGSHATEFAGVYERAAAHSWRVIELELARTVRPLRELVSQWKPAGCILEGSSVSAADARRAFRGIPVVNLDPGAKTAASTRGFAALPTLRMTLAGSLRSSRRPEKRVAMVSPRQ